LCDEELSLNVDVKFDKELSNVEILLSFSWISTSSNVKRLLMVVKLVLIVWISALWLVIYFFFV
jgi:DNA polymerase sigma